MRKSLYSKKQKLLLASLKRARIDAGMTQQQLADALKKPQSFVAKTENGERRLDVIEFVEICEVLSEKTSVLLSRIES